MAVRPADAASAALANTSVAVQTGAQLELDAKWPAAIEHYEQALDLWPDNESLKFGLRRSKIHFHVARRYVDPSFTSEMLRLSEREALDQWTEIYNLVNRNYVDRINRTSYVAHGTESLYLALANEQFLKSHRLTADDENVKAMRQLLRDAYWNRPIADESHARQVMTEVADLCNRRLGLPRTAVIMEYIFGSKTLLDDYSSYLTPERLRDLYANIEGEFVGLGIEMKGEEGQGMLLVNVLPKSPAEEGGARAGDHIVSIDGVDCRNMTTEKAAAMLRGTSGSRVQLELETKDGRRKGPLSFVRREVQIESIPVAKMIDRENGIGYVRMTSFQRSTTRELDRAMQDLKAQGMRSLIWDLRGNPGGLLTVAVEVLDRFLDGGTIVSTKGRNRDQNWSYSAHAAGTWRGELVLLIDSNSASASEIAAGAIKDHRRGTLVGRHSYGKWSVQTIFNASHSTGMRLTTAKFYSPRGKNYSHKGLEPDVEVALPEEHATFYRGFEYLNESDDADIRQAVQILRRSISRR